MGGNNWPSQLEPKQPKADQGARTLMGQQLLAESAADQGAWTLCGKLWLRAPGLQNHIFQAFFGPKVLEIVLDFKTVITSIFSKNGQNGHFDGL
jgi:hypothetical protein